MKKDNRFAFDTNVLVSAMLFPDSVPALALKKAFSIGTVVVSEECMEELSRVITDEKFEKYSSFLKRQMFLLDFEDASEFVQVKSKIALCRDPKDDKYLSLAVSAKAKAIITGDHDLLLLNPFKNISTSSMHRILILSPSDFLNNFTA